MKCLLQLSLVAVTFLFSCKKVDEQNNGEGHFSWAKAGNKLHYNFYTATDTFLDYRSVNVSDFNSKTSFHEQITKPDTILSSNNQLYFIMLDRDFVIKEDGLYGIGCEDCGFFGCVKPFNFLYAPVDPILNQDLPVYGCRNTASSSNIIENIDTVIEVPLGKFKTYIMRHPNGDRSFWNSNDGIIMYEANFGNRRGILKLTYISK